jgi:ribonuclease E
MTVVDVNTGKFVGSGGNLEETVTKNNLEAAEEIVRQLRLRDIGGIIVVDFIDMVLESNRDLVLRRLMECLSRDRTKHQVAEVTSLGLVQMTRKKLGLGLLETFSDACDACDGRGVIIHNEPHMRSKNSAPDQPQRSDRVEKRDKRKSAKQEVAKVVTPERANEINSVVAKIAASTIAAHEAAGEQSLISALKVNDGDASAPSVKAHTQAPVNALDAVLQALPEPTAPGQGRRKSRRVTTQTITTGEVTQNND